MQLIYYLIIGCPLVRTITPKQIIVYSDADGNEPFVKWIDSIRDKKNQQRIRSRLRRLEQGHYGDYKMLGEGIFELRMFFGSGYRVYCGDDGERIVILLCGGDKGSQKRDITRAKSYWKEYRENG